MRFLFLLLLILSLFWKTQVMAQMFASIEQCDAIYGTPITPTEKTSDVRFYKQESLTIKILFVEKKATVLTYTAASPDKISSAIQLKILGNNASGNQWEDVIGEGPKTWRRSDGLAFAIYDNSSGELSLFSADYLEKASADTEPAVARP